MRNYETMVIVDAVISDDTIANEIQGLEEKIAARAEIVRKDDWGKRKLAYEIKKRTHGYYVIFYYKTEDSQLVADLEADMKLNGNMLRWMTLVDYPMTERVYGEDIEDDNLPEPDHDED